MATYRKRGKAWRVEINKKGIRRSATFSTKAEATAWAAMEESGIAAGNKAVKNVTYAAMLEKYAEEVSPKKGGKIWEERRLAFFARSDLGKKKLGDLAESDFAKWRDTRLKEVSPGTVNRDWNLLSNVFTIAIKEWGWLNANPMSSVKRPKEPAARDRLPQQDETEKLLHVLGYSRESNPVTDQQRIAAAYLFAIETGMRQGEVAILTKDDVDYRSRVANVLQSKTAAVVREVPLSLEAIRILKSLPDDLFGLAASQMDVAFRKAKKEAGIDDLHFHDTRAAFATRASKRLDMLALARVMGIKKLQVLQVYYREPVSNMAHLLD